MYSKRTSIDFIPVSGLMTINVKTATENQTIRAVCKAMYEVKIGCMIILKNSNHDDNNGSKEPIGIVTERDIVHLMGSSDKSLGDVSVSEVMSSPLITINPNSSIRDAIETMQQKDIRRLPAVNDKRRMVGIITNKDIFRMMMKNVPLITSFLSDQILVGQGQSINTCLNHRLLVDDILRKDEGKS
jgi:CBS domain-containing protein